MAATRKEEKYVDLGARYIFEPIAVETLVVFNASARHLLDDLGSRISENTGEARETSFLYQRISILVQRFNAVLLHDSLMMMMMMIDLTWHKVLGLQGHVTIMWGHIIVSIQ